MTKILSLAAALLAVLMLALGATSAPAADKPSVADDVAQRLGITSERLQAAFRRRSRPASTLRSRRAS